MSALGWFIFGLMTGGTVGTLIMAILRNARSEDDYNKEDD